MTLQEEYRAQREKLATGYGFGDFIDMFAAPMEPPVFLSAAPRPHSLQKAENKPVYGLENVPVLI